MVILDDYVRYTIQLTVSIPAGDRYPVSAAYEFGSGHLVVTYANSSIESYTGVMPWGNSRASFGLGEVYAHSGYPYEYIYEENGYTVIFIYQPGGSID